MLAKYRSWLARLEQTQADYVRRLPRYQKGFLALTACGVGCFAFGVMPGIWGTLCATFVSVGGYYMLKTRFWELAAEIEETEGEIRRLQAVQRAAARTSSSAGLKA